MNCLILGCAAEAGSMRAFDRKDKSGLLLRLCPLSRKWFR